MSTPSPSASPSSASARAEARRKAILARGGDRLAKLTSSSRADDPAYANITPVSIIHDDPPLPSFSTGAFLGEDSANMPAPRFTASRHSPSPAPSTRASPAPFSGDPSVWSEAQQEQLMAAFMGNPNPNNNASSAEDPAMAALNANMRMFQNQFTANSDTSNGQNPSIAGIPGDDASVFSALGNMGLGMGALGGLGPGMNGINMDAFAGTQQSFQAAPPPKPKSIFERSLPLIHLLCTWALLSLFITWVEPKAFFPGSPVELGFVQRWAGLLSAKPDSLSIGGISAVPFFAAFITLQILLHTIQFLSTSSASYDASLPSLLQLALPYLPPPIPTVVRTGIRYFRMASVLMDDLAGLVVGVGIWIWISSFLNAAEIQKIGVNDT